MDRFSLDHPSNRSNGKYDRLVPLRKRESTFKDVYQAFQKGWRHPEKAKPHVYAILRILSRSDVIESYLKYRETVATTLERDEKTAQNPGNEQLLFHGTTRHCLLAEDPTRTTLCFSPQCYLCCILRGSYDISRCGTKHKFRRFGTGIYTTACSSKADDYIANGDQAAKLRVILANRVVVGRAMRKKYNFVNMTRPPQGHHSVVGEPGGDLNYEETVVYDNDAIRPAYLIIYGDPPRKERKKPKDVFKMLFKTPLLT